MIELQHLTKRFATQGGTVVALNDINLTIRDGDVYGIIGMSGAGNQRWYAASICWSARTREMLSSTASRCKTCAPPTCARPGVRSP